MVALPGPAKRDGRRRGPVAIVPLPVRWREGPWDQVSSPAR